MNLLLPIDKECVSKVVCAHFELPLKELQSSRRPERIAKPRQIIFYLLHEMRRASYSSIARAFGKDVGTVRWGVVKVAELMTVDVQFYKTVQMLESQCREAMEAA